MDGNGNSSSKVSTLRHHFENYDKIEQRKSSVVAATIYPTVPPSASLVSTKLLGKSKASESSPEHLDQERKSRDRSCRGNSRVAIKNKTNNANRSSADIKSYAHGLVPDPQKQSSSDKHLMSASVAAATTADAASRRNGIYLGDESNKTLQQQRNKRRGLVILDDDDVVTVHHCPPEVCDEEEYMDEEDDGMDEELEDMEHDDDPAEETTIPIAFDRHEEGQGDGSSITSHSTTSSRHSFHNFMPSAKSSQGMLSGGGGSTVRNPSALLEGDSRKIEKPTTIPYLPHNNNSSSNNNNNGSGESKANTPTSSSSCSSGSGGCGKVKRRNAFRHKDVSTFPTSAAAGDGSSSAILAAVSKTKVAVERVKSLDSTSTTVTSSLSDSVGQNNSGSSMPSALVSSSRKGLSGGAFAQDSPSKSRELVNSAPANLSGDRMEVSSAEGIEKSCAPSFGGSGNNPHELLSGNNNNFSGNSNTNNESKGSPAQRAASLCVRMHHSSHNTNSTPPGSSAFARNPGTNNRPPPPHHLHHHQQHHHPSSANNNHVVNSPDNLANNSINQQQTGSSQRVVNVVTPYQVTDIYNQLKMSDTSVPAYVNSSAGSGKHHSLKQMSPEVEYAVPMIQSQPQRFQQVTQHAHSPQNVSFSEVPPKVPPPPLNYPPSSIRKEQFGLPSPNSSYTFLPHRNPQGMLKTGTSTAITPQTTSFKPSGCNNSTTEALSSPSVKTKDMKKGAVAAPCGPPEKPPRTFLYNQAAVGALAPAQQQAHGSNALPKQSKLQSVNKMPHAKQSTVSSRNQSSVDLYAAAVKTAGKGTTGSDNVMGLSLASQTKRQHSSSSSSSTLTSGTAVTSHRQQMSPSSSSSSLKKLETSPNSTSVSTATVRQTSTVASMSTPMTQRKLEEVNESLYAARMKRRADEAGSNNGGGSKGNNNSGTPEKPRSTSLQSNNNSKHHYNHHHRHQHIHPPLVRSKTESQLVVKSKNNTSRFMNRPSDVTVTYGMEMMSLEPGHYHQDLTILSSGSSNNHTGFSHPGVMTVGSYYAANGPPVHHQSQTNLLNVTSRKIYEQQQYRSINNLLRYSNNAGPSSIYDKYPSNPGLHYASRELAWLDNGLPPVSSVSGSGGSNYNLYSSGDNHQSTRLSSLMYTTNIDISCGDQQVGASGARQAPPAFGEGSQQRSNVDLLQQPNSLYGMTSDNQSVQRQLLRNNARFNNQYVQHPLHHYRLSERSKSEWALNAVQYGSSGDPSLSSMPAHRPHRLQQQINNSKSNTGSVTNNNNNSISSDCSNQCTPLPPHLMGRRATVAISGSSAPGPNSGAPVSLSGAGHPNLDSPVSSHNNSNNSSLTSIQHTSAATKSHRHHHANVPNSIQHLVNQLFSTSNIKDATSSTDSGIQLGSESLSSCDTPIGDSTTDTGDSDCENEGDVSNSARKVVEARKGYVRRVSSVRVQELGESLHRLIQSSKIPHNIDPLFECLLVVGLDRDPTNGIYHPYIREKFPRDAKLAEGVEQFCFPDSMEWPCHEGSTAQFYTLAITDQRGGRKFGCCFRILPEGANFCIPITYCIISSHRAIGFYREILREITSCHGHSEYQRRHFLQELYKKSFPPPGNSISVTEPTIEETYMHSDQVGYGSLTGSPPKSITIRRRADHRLDEGDLVTLVSTVDLSVVIKLFGSLLLERKVVLLSRALSTLSLCVEALESLLYPFNWQHTFVPILPLDMTDVIDAPAPFLIGVLRSSRTAWDKTLDDGIVVDLDVENGKIISCVGDEGTILPKRIHRKLRNALSQLVLDLADQKESTKNVLISECFIRMFVETLGHYSNHIITKPDGSRALERDSFVKSVESKATQNFLEWFSETSMFNEFIEMKLKNSQQHGLFEQRVIEQIESGPIVHGGSNSGTPLKKDIWVKMKAPFGSWLKDTFK